MSRRTKGWLLAFGMLLLLLLGSAPTARGAPELAAPAPALCPWIHVPSPAPNTGFAGGVAFAPDNAWAVGSGGDVNGMALVAHWDGSAWSRVPVPRRAHDFLFGVAAVSSTDLWAVGSSDDPGPGSDTFVLHWDGAQWTIIPSPNAGPGTNWLLGVAAVSATDVWAVGQYEGQLLI